MKITLVTLIMSFVFVLPSLAYIIPNAKYPSEDVILAQIIAGPSYGILPDGNTDCTEGLRNAVADCEAVGGGTVFLPAGEYLVTGPVCIPSTVVLRGDWTDPLKAGKKGDPGTVIIAKPAKEPLGRSPYSGALFTVEASAGLMGLTFWYPEQNGLSPAAYGPTVCVKPHDDDYVTTNVYKPKRIVSCATLKNLTLVNSYRGISAEYSHELCQLETIRVCGLDYGIKMCNSTDVGYSTDIMISPDVWLDAGKYSCANPEVLRYYCKENTE
ncbi:MAG: hypothetical protein ILO36_09445, partial [Abditibacteriota bacterium]|nr:hypothetical protein [Abditibacteriota bacterium]